MMPRLCSLLLVAGCLTMASAAERPNILWITTEDMGLHLGAYGDPDASTPHLDRLAAEGVRFTDVQASSGVCAPSRSSLIMGMYASSLGSQHMRGHATLPEGIRPLPSYLRNLGYYCSNRFKEDYNFATPAGAWNDSSREAGWEGRAPGQPFFSVINFMTTHESRLRFSDSEFTRLTAALTPDQRHNPDRVTLPAWLPDAPEVRREWARYHDLISAMDHQVGAVLAKLEADGLADDTVVFFFSDHGAGLPRAKQFVYEAGLQVPLLVRVPEKWRHRLKVAPGSVDDRKISLVDLAPTMLALAGAPVPDHMQGQVVLGEGATPRTYFSAVRDRMDERVDLTRTFNDGRFKYHRHYLPHVPPYPWLDYMDQLETAKALRARAAQGTLSPALQAFMAPDKPLEELYDLQRDPDELHNLAGDPAYADTLMRMREAHFDWVRRTRDTGFVPEQMLRDFAEGRSEYAFARSEDYRLDRIVETVRLLEKGPASVPALRASLRDDYGPVRYWAATQLVSLGEAARPAMAELGSVLDDLEAEVAIAAAEALCGLGETATALPVLVHYLRDPRPIVSLAAANVLDRLDERALPVRKDMEEVAAVDPGSFAALNLRLMVQWVLNRALLELDSSGVKAGAPTADLPSLTEVGVASVDITPPAPVRLHGFPRGDRAASLSAVAQPIRAQALAIGGNEGDGPVLLVNAEILGVSAAMREELARRLAAEAGFANAERLTLTANHNHSAPAIASVAPFVLREPPTAREAAEIAAYETFLMDRLVEVAKAALGDRRPARLEHGLGKGDFAMNRRVVQKGTWTGFGDNPSGPVDHDLPVMAVRRPDGTLRAVWLSYACHGVCWQKPSVHGDWMGVARREIEADHRGAIAVVTVGCAGNINPKDVFFRGEDPETPGRSAAAEVQRVLSGPMSPLAGAPTIAWDHFDLPLQSPPGLAELADRTDWFGRTMRKQLAKGEKLATTLPFSAQSWRFGDRLMILFLSGEVHVQYGLKIKEKIGSERLWVNAYANATPGYIPVASELPEGGWEVDGSRRNYGIPARLAPAAETLLHERIAALVPADFAAAATNKDAAWWRNTGHPRGQWWLDYPGYEGDAADKIWQTVPIPPSPVLSPQEALQSFQVAEGYRIELVAAEPLIVRPVFMRFDEAGRLWVVEMPGYMRDIDGTDEEKPSGRVVVLEDDNGDGRMDRATTFLDGLVMPRTLALVPGGALVVEPPRIWLARDTNGDLVADEKILLADDYGVGDNPEHSANGLLPALDNWLYSAKSAVRYRYRDGALTAEPTVFRGQWGISQDDTGRLFYNYNASPLHADLAPGQYFLGQAGPNLALQRNVAGPMLLNASLVEDRALFPVRVTPLVTLGASDLRPDGTLKQFTAASAPFIYRGALFPADLRGDAFIADPVGNLVSHQRLRSDGLRLQAGRSHPSREFLASTDERFRPVFLESGPEGALYIADMYTGIVEHKRYVTDYLRKQVLGRDIGGFTATGRIYRVVPADHPSGPSRKNLPTTAAAWVARLDDADGWMRDTAQRVLVQGAHVAQIPAVRSVAVDLGRSPLGRLHALWTLEGLQALTGPDIATAVADPDARVRAAAVRLSEQLSRAEQDRLASRLASLAGDASVEVRLQVLLTAGTWPDGRGWTTLGSILSRTDAVEEFGLAAATGLRGRELEFLDRTLPGLAQGLRGPAWPRLLEQLSFNVVVRGQEGEVARLLERLGNLAPTDPRAEALWRGAGRHKRNGAPLALPVRPMIFAQVESWGEIPAAKEAQATMQHLTWPGDTRFAGKEARPLTGPEQALFAKGRETYQMLCAACHQVDGMGMAGVAPPLAGSKWVVGNPRIPIEIALRGVAGPIEVNGQIWDMVMPGFAPAPGMSDDETLAALTTYLRRAWGNAASPVSPEDAGRLRALAEGRAQPWTARELEALPAYETLENAR